MRSFFLNAQPSGGFYGSIAKVYEIPANANTVNYVAPNGNASSVGTELEKSISTAINPVLVVWSPAKNENCQTEITDLVELTKLYSSYCNYWPCWFCF